MKECQYCKTYQDAPSQHRNNTIDGKFINESRWCPIVKSFVDCEAAGCVKFEVAKYFWCIKNNQWLHFPVCIKRQNNKEEGCVHCSQGRNLVSVLRGVPGNGKPVLLRRPGLIRRPTLVKKEEEPWQTP